MGTRKDHTLDKALYIHYLPSLLKKQCIKKSDCIELYLQSTPANPDTEGTEENRPDMPESGLAGKSGHLSGFAGVCII